MMGFLWEALRWETREGLNRLVCRIFGHGQPVNIHGTRFGPQALDGLGLDYQVWYCERCGDRLSEDPSITNWLGPEDPSGYGSDP